MSCGQFPNLACQTREMCTLSMVILHLVKTVPAVAFLAFFFCFPFWSHGLFRLFGFCSFCSILFFVPSLSLSLALFRALCILSLLVLCESLANVLQLSYLVQSYLTCTYLVLLIHTLTLVPFVFAYRLVFDLISPIRLVYLVSMEQHPKIL